MDDDMMYGNALSGLASGMAGGGASGGDMMPCPMCQGTGMVDASMLMGEGVPAMPPRLAARGAMPAMAGGGGMPMPSPRMS